MINKIKLSLGILSDDEELDSSINLKIQSIQGYLKNAGASDKAINSELGISCIAIGVNDLMNQQAGATKLSPAFKMLANQIARM